MVTLSFPWLELVVIFGIGAILAAVLVAVIKLFQRQRYVRRSLPWFVRSMAAIGILSFLISDMAEVTAYLLFLVIPAAFVLGLLLALLIAPLVSIFRRSIAAGFWTGCSILEGSLLMAIITTTIICHLIGEPMAAELANSETAGDSLLGITYSGLVFVCAVIPASLIGSVVGGVTGRTQR